MAKHCILQTQGQNETIFDWLVFKGQDI